MSRPEQLETYALAGIGLARGIYELTVGERDQGTKAWMAIGAFVLAYEVCCDDDQLLSQTVDRFIDRHPVLGRALPAYTAAHLINILPKQVDIFHQLGVVSGKILPDS